MRLTITPLPFKPPRMTHLSRNLLDTHYETHYGAALRRHNALASLDPETDAITPRQRTRWRGSVLLHEHYFAGLTDEDDTTPSTALRDQIAQDFGSIDRWIDGLVANAISAVDGWLLVTWCERSQTLIALHLFDESTFTNDHGILLSLDLAPHAYASEFGNDMNAYIRATCAHLNWTRLNQRFDHARGMSGAVNSVAQHPSRSPEDLASTLTNPESVTLLDVRMREDVRPHDQQIEGSVWADPENVAAWVDTLDPTKPVVVYCLYGAWVSEQTAAAVRDAGFDAYLLSGGISSWQALQLPVKQVELPENTTSLESDSDG